MAEGLFSRARVALCDAAYMNRQTTLGGLQSIGFANVEPYGRIGQLADALQYTNFDLIIAELRDQEAQVFKFIKALRARKIGCNPFSVVILTAWDLNEDTVRGVLSSGADDLLGRPFSIKQLQQRVLGTINQRKHYVVTCDYLGPSRRSGQRPEDAESMFDPPNSLKNHTGNRGELSQSEIEETWRYVMQWRVYRYGERLGLIIARLRSEGAADGQVKDIATAAKMLKALGACAAQMEKDALVVPACDSERLVAYASVLKQCVQKIFEPPEDDDATETKADTLTSGERAAPATEGDAAEQTGEPRRPNALELGRAARTFGVLQDVVAHIRGLTDPLKPRPMREPETAGQPDTSQERIAL